MVSIYVALNITNYSMYRCNVCVLVPLFLTIFINERFHRGETCWALDNRLQFNAARKSPRCFYTCIVPGTARVRTAHGTLCTIAKHMDDGCVLSAHLMRDVSFFALVFLLAFGNLCEKSNFATEGLNNQWLIVYSFSSEFRETFTGNGSTDSQLPSFQVEIKNKFTIKDELPTFKFKGSWKSSCTDRCQREQ